MQSQIKDVDRISLPPSRQLLSGLTSDRFAAPSDCPCKLFMICNCLVIWGCENALLHHANVTSQQKFQPARRGQCSGNGAFLHFAGALAPSAWWRWRPASLAPPKAQTLTGCHWAHLLCPPIAWMKRWQYKMERIFKRKKISYMKMKDKRFTVDKT